MNTDQYWVDPDQYQAFLEYYAQSGGASSYVEPRFSGLFAQQGHGFSTFIRRATDYIIPLARFLLPRLAKGTGRFIAGLAQGETPGIAALGGLKAAVQGGGKRKRYSGATQQRKPRKTVASKRKSPSVATKSKRKPAVRTRDTIF